MKTVLAALAIVCLFAGSATANYQPVAVKPAKTAANEDDVAELLTILDETTSIDTFVVTLQALVGLEPERKGLMAALIKNADRLGMLKGVTSGKVTPELEIVSEALEKIVEARNEAKTRNTRPATRYQPPAVPVTPASESR
jgi:hypothetical protein